MRRLVLRVRTEGEGEAEDVECVEDGPLLLLTKGADSGIFEQRTLRSSHLGAAGLRLTQVQVSVPQYPPICSSHVWAVIIGINDYQDGQMSPLEGCVSDALAMNAYLTDDLHVPLDHIWLLSQSPGDYPPVSASPTRQNILAALYNLRDNPRIRRGENILIYYSGHGSAYYASDAFSNPIARVVSIEALCPEDRGVRLGPRPDDIVCDISDREINVLISAIRDVKGPHITLILDSCYAGGMARGVAAPAPAVSCATVRSVNLLPLAAMLRVADADVRRWRASRRAFTKMWRWDTSACVLLAACRDTEQAYEWPVVSSPVIKCGADSFFDLEDQPKRVAVIGAGYIAVELAGVLHTLGLETHLVIRRDHVLRTFDPTLQETLTPWIEHTGINLHKNGNVVNVEGAPGQTLTVTTDKGTKIEVDTVLWAIGHRPNTDNLGLEKAGFRTDKKDDVEVDEWQVTNMKGTRASRASHGGARFTSPSY